MSEKTTHDLSYTRILKLAIPVTMAQLLIFSCSMVDLVFIKNFGHEVIATMGITNTVYNTIISFAEGLVAGTAVLIAKHVNQHNIQRCGQITGIAIVLALFFGLGFYLTESWLSHTVFANIGQGELLGYGPAYLGFWLKSLVAVFFLFVCEGIFRGIENTTLPLVSIIIVTVLNIFFDYALIYGKLGFPAYGYVGAAMGSCFAYYIGAGSIMLMMLTNTRMRQITRQVLQRYTVDAMKEYGRIFLDIGFYTGFMVAALIINNCIIGAISTQALAINQIVFQLFLFFYLSAIGFMASTSVLVAGLKAKNQLESIPVIIKKTTHITLILAGLISMLLIVFAQALAHYFLGDDEALISQAVIAIRLIAIAQVNTSVYMVLRGVLTGFDDTKFIACMGLTTSYILFLPLSYLFSVYLKFGIIGNYCAFLLWTISDVMLFAHRCYRKGLINLPSLINNRSIINVKHT